MCSRLSSLLPLACLWAMLPQSATNSSATSNGLSRSKRFLIFEGSGVCKLVLGFSLPMNLMDRHPFRHLTLSYAFHLQYTAPVRPLYWWTYFVNSTAWEHARHRQSKTLLRPHVSHYGTFVERPGSAPVIAYDASRAFVYKALGVFFDSKGLPGDKCVLRAICELSQRPLHEDSALSGIVNAVFRPTEPNVEGKYLHAMRIGVRNADCEKVYWSCREGMKWLRQFLYETF